MSRPFGEAAERFIRGMQQEYDDQMMREIAPSRQMWDDYYESERLAYEEAFGLLNDDAPIEPKSDAPA